MTTTAGPPAAAPSAAPKPELAGRRPTREQIILYVLVLVPFLALAAAIPVAWGGGLNWHDAVLAVTFYVVSGLGVTVGFHRYLTHGSFKAQPWLRRVLAIAGSLAVQGSVIRW